MAYSNFPSRTDQLSSSNVPSTNQSAIDSAPPIGSTPPEILAQDASDGRRGAAWRLLIWIIENDPRAVTAVAALEDDRLARHLLEFIAVGTWAGKPFIVPKPLRSAYARTRLRTLFLPEAGMNPVFANRVLLEATRDNRLEMRETAIYILGIIGSRAGVPVRIDALHDPILSIRLQAAKALGRIGDVSAIPALLNALPGADEQMGGHIFSALVHLGHASVPSLMEKSKSQSAWIRWHCIRALGEIADGRALPVLIQALSDTDHSVAWMAAKGLVRLGRRSTG